MRSIYSAIESIQVRGLEEDAGETRAPESLFDGGYWCPFQLEGESCKRKGVVPGRGNISEVNIDGQSWQDQHVRGQCCSKVAKNEFALAYQQKGGHNADRSGGRFIQIEYRP